MLDDSTPTRTVVTSSVKASVVSECPSKAITVTISCRVTIAARAHAAIITDRANFVRTFAIRCDAARRGVGVAWRGAARRGVPEDATRPFGNWRI